MPVVERTMKRKRPEKVSDTNSLRLRAVTVVMWLLLQQEVTAFVPATRDMVSNSPRELQMGYSSQSLNRMFASSVGSFEEESRTIRIYHEAENRQMEALQCIRARDYRKALACAQEILSICEKSKIDVSGSLAATGVLDQTIQSLTKASFASPISSSDYGRVLAGVGAVNLQLRSSAVKPFHTVPRETLVSSLQALSSLLIAMRDDRSSPRINKIMDLSYRVLQRLVTGVGVRNSRGLELHEKEFCTLLNAFCEVGRMDLAHRIIALQERTEHAPPLSAVTFSILLKGYGKLGDQVHVEKTLKRAEELAIKPDTILVNSIMDALVNCGAVDRAENVFTEIKTHKRGQRFCGHPCPTLNGRSHNILLKGYANSGRLADALKLSESMKRQGLWDTVTTNLLVHAAVIAGNLTTAVEVLDAHTARQTTRHSEHPNVGAYTDLLDAYGKQGELKEAVQVFSTMRKRNVEPNIYTYGCMIASFGRKGQLERVRSMLDFMHSRDILPSVVIYNALISSLLETESGLLGQRIDQSLMIIDEMRKSGIIPNDVTASIIVKAMSRCSPPRITEASAFVEKLEREKILTRNPRVVAALVKAYGTINDADAAWKEFRGLDAPDVYSVNALVETLCLTGRVRAARGIFSRYFGKGRSVLPDRVSFGVMISALFKNRDDRLARQEAIDLYHRMVRQGITPDCGIIDAVLKPSLQLAQASTLTDNEVRFVALILRDAERLTWPDGQLERRKRAVRSVLADRLRIVLGDSLDVGVVHDELFLKHGWNEVDSGFRLWSGAPAVDIDSAERSDKFLISKGWNNIDSGFRLL